MGDTLHIRIQDTYRGYDLVSSVSLFRGTGELKQSWQEENHIQLIDNVLEATYTDVFEMVIAKKMLRKAIELFEPTAISFEEKS